MCISLQPGRAGLPAVCLLCLQSQTSSSCAHQCSCTPGPQNALAGWLAGCGSVASVTTLLLGQASSVACPDTVCV